MISLSTETSKIYKHIWIYSTLQMIYGSTEVAHELTDLSGGGLVLNDKTLW